MNDKKWTAWHTAGLLIIAVVIVLMGYLVRERVRSWLVPRIQPGRYFM